MTDQDEFDQLRDRIESLEAAVDTDTSGDDFPLEGEVFLKLNDASGGHIYAEPESVNEIGVNGPSVGNMIDFDFEDGGATKASDYSETRDCSWRWNVANIQIVTREEVLEEEGL